MSPPPPAEDDRDAVRRYHERTKHHLQRYARSLGYLDWATQPHPFRHYAGAEEIPLAHPAADDGPTWDELLAAPPTPRSPDLGAISELFYYSLALSAWKEAGGNRWSLRVNPSSGDLHPTEAYLIAGPIQGLNLPAAVYHYTPYRHALELRLPLTEDEWQAFIHPFPRVSLFIALASIPWREAWKYGERAYRYCHHDIGHAIACLAFSARLLGWQTQLIMGFPDDELDDLLGLRRQRATGAVEDEHADCLLACTPGPATGRVAAGLPNALRERLVAARFHGTPNRLSPRQHPWPEIDKVLAAARYDGSVRVEACERPAPAGSEVEKRHTPPARQIIRKRRSAVAMDGHTRMTTATFYRILTRLSPAFAPFPHEVLPWPPRVSLAVFVHRVAGLAPGLYLLARTPDHLESLRMALDRSFVWKKPAGLPAALDFFLLWASDLRETAQIVSCHQEIAADGIFSVGMLARFDAALAEGAWNYPRLYWECGLLGQILYLEAEAAGVRGTGIGCFFDDAMHRLLGITDTAWQSLYHFTVGGALDDPRLKTLPAYHHLGSLRA